MGQMILMAAPRTLTSTVVLFGVSKNKETKQLSFENLQNDISNYMKTRDASIKILYNRKAYPSHEKSFLSESTGDPVGFSFFFSYMCSRSEHDFLFFPSLYFPLCFSFRSIFLFV